MNRRGFLTGILALGAAPAIVRAESLMKIWTPPKELILPTLDITIDNIVAGGVYKFSYHIKNKDGAWDHVIQRIGSAGTTKIPLPSANPILWGIQLEQVSGISNDNFGGVSLAVSNNGSLILREDESPLQRGAVIGNSYARGYK